MAGASAGFGGGRMAGGSFGSGGSCRGGPFGPYCCLLCDKESGLRRRFPDSLSLFGHPSRHLTSTANRSPTTGPGVRNCGPQASVGEEKCESGRIGLTANELSWETGTQGSNPCFSASENHAGAP